MTVEEMRKANPIILWILGGVCSLLLMVCSFFLMQIFQEFKEFKRTSQQQFRSIMINQQVLMNRVERNSDDLEKINYNHGHGETTRNNTSTK